MPGFARERREVEQKRIGDILLAELGFANSKFMEVLPLSGNVRIVTRPGYGAPGSG